MAVQKSSAYAEIYISRIISAISITLGIGSASALARSVHFLQTIGAFVLIILLTFYIQSKILEWKGRYHNIFELLLRLVYRTAEFTQQLLSSLVANIVRIKIEENDEDNEYLLFRSRIMLYGSMFMLFATTTLLFDWYFYEEVEHDESRVISPEILEQLEQDKKRD